VNGQLVEREVGALAGAAVGDALGGATEGWESREIREHCGGWVEGVIRSIRHDKDMVKPFSPFWKGDGHVTDDTLMTRVLVRAYAAKRDHLDAYDMERLVVPSLVDAAMWIPELDRSGSRTREARTRRMSRRST
jgi:ADP-ribosylglycohydrolase